ncbi:MAG: hypothetical protein ACREA0_09375 [bacterium]
MGRQLHQWFEQVDHLIDSALFGIAPEGPHRDAVVLNILSRNARLIREFDIDRQDALYGPLCFMLSAACRRLGLRLGRQHWEAAVTNVISLSLQLTTAREASTSMGLDIASPARVLKEQVDEALLHAGVAGVPTFLDAEGRRIALGLAVNWGIRLLCAYALECEELPAHPARHDLAWIRELLRPLLESVVSEPQAP